MCAFRSFAVRLPSGERYWTVLDSACRPVPEADEWLLHVRLGQDRAESTTQAYATALALLLQWCTATGRDWRTVMGELGRFVFWLRYYDPDGEPGAPRRVVRNAGRVNAVMAAVREFVRYAVTVGMVASRALDALYDTVEDTDLPADVRGERPTGVRSRPRHRLSAPERTVEAATDEEVLALLRACRSARDRFIVLALWRIGHRRGEVTGLRLEDVHFVPDSTRLGCPERGEHVHVRRRDNPNKAMAKSRRSRAVPADWLLVQAFDQYLIERNACGPARRCDFVLVNLFRGEIGAPMRPAAINELFEALSRRARLSRTVRPHMLRHGFATNIIAAGATVDELKELLGHSSFTSSEVYVHTDRQRLRDAVDRVGTPRPAGG
ncbi:tyrosine-type recombinase/integrase [Allosaccharopolyspora coralli]|uniref:Tyrosine-type recombinase/integrase n=1 Tax=Allosaccharopolyspora coralli TaxID=2665642 RepID=A0A5Q3QAU5_9PSEU|nr:tyrosine-type recombinase/integrase [Allosaccharopolyspora coralli]QGK70324.1 tyrosine-type recombinase/integrase [Allosaccharopolyspora coralli]